MALELVWQLKEDVKFSLDVEQREERFYLLKSPNGDFLFSV